MSAAMFMDSNQKAWPAHGGMAAATIGAAAVRRELDGLSRKIGIVRGMLTTLDTLSAAGQHDVMSRVVTFIRAHGDDGSADLPRDSFAHLFAELERESDRSWPITWRFVDRAERLLALLADA